MEDIILNSKITIPSASIVFKFTRSSGKGGQNVNKVSTKVELLFLINELRAGEELKTIIKDRLQNRIDSEGMIRIVSQESRSQWQNKRIAIAKLSDLILKASFIDRHRVATKPSYSSKIRRVEGKKIAGKRKELRRKNIRQSDD